MGVVMGKRCIDAENGQLSVGWKDNGNVRMVAADHAIFKAFFRTSRSGPFARASGRTVMVLGLPSTPGREARSALMRRRQFSLAPPAIRGIFRSRSEIGRRILARRPM